MPGLPGGGTPPPANATGADAGVPGAWTPAGSTAPADAAQTATWGVVANPATAWTTGQYVQTAAGPVSWNGAAWVAGAALSADALAGWTLPELKQFAEDHDPPIPVPSGANKSQIIALILAALEADSEEN